MIFRNSYLCVWYRQGTSPQVIKRQKMQLKCKQATGTFFMVLWSSEYIVAKWKGLIWLAFGAEKERILLRFALVRPSPEAFNLCDSFIFLPHPLVFWFVSTWVSHCLWNGHCFWNSFCSALSFIEKKNNFLKKKPKGYQTN